MPSAGDTFQGNGDNTHLYVVITSPDAIGAFAIVNLTTKRDRRGEDQTCILVRGEHPFVRHDTIINYFEAYITDEAAFRALAGQGHIILNTPTSAAILRRIQDGALLSRHTPAKIKIAVRAELDKLPEEPES